MKPVHCSIAATALLLAGCGDPGPVANGAANVSALPAAETAPPDEITGQGDAEPGSAATPSAPAARAAAQIPSALRGRWSHDPAGCSAEAPSAGSLMVVTADQLRFEGSRATPVADIEATPESISGDFTFENGGKAWTRFQAMELRDGQLVRTQGDPIESYTYIRCD